MLASTLAQIYDHSKHARLCYRHLHASSPQQGGVLFSLCHLHLQFFSTILKILEYPILDL